MFGFLRRLLGTGHEHRATPRSLALGSGSETSGSGDVLRQYFALSERIVSAKTDRNYALAIAASRETYPLLPAVVRDWKREYGRFDITTSHAVHTGGTLMAVMGELEGLRELRRVLESVPELREWLPVADESEKDAELAEGIVDVVSRSPGVLQSELKGRLGAQESRRVSQLAQWLEKAGRLRRIRSGKTFRLMPIEIAASVAPADTAPRASSVPPKPSLTTRREREAKTPRLIDLQSLPYVRLPKAPIAWQERQRGGEEGAGGSGSRRQNDPVLLVDAPGWSLVAVDSLPLGERPDPAFRDVYPTGGWTYWVDPKGHREAHPDSAAVLRVSGKSGAVEGERGLIHDVYRADANTDGSAIIFLSRNGILHAYDHRLEHILEEQLSAMPEYVACANRLGIESRELRNHVRCVAISPDATRYVYTVVDEAWCVSRSGDVLWGLRMPTQEGWSRAASPRSERAGTRAEVDAALHLLDLQFPVAPDAVAQRYRQLAMRWHPDRNPGDPAAVTKMQQLNAGMELLIGVDLTGLGAATLEVVTYQKILSHHVVEVPGGRISMSIMLGGSEKSAADWIYAADFAWKDNGVFLASYGGKVVEVSQDGAPVMVYDVGAVPRHIADTGAYLYLLTDTRLYVLAGERLETLVDVLDKGDLILGETGFGVQAPKLFSWFSPTGNLMGSVSARDPIRRVLSTPDALVVETRQHRARIRGAQSWWRHSPA